MDKFPCTMCGCCCKRVNLIQGFPYKSTNGVCEMLENNKCKVYENRPEICNVDFFLKKLNADKKEFYKQNADICNIMMDEDGIDKSFRVWID